MSNTPRTITNEELKTAARKAIDEGRLLAFAPGYTGSCLYRAEIGGKQYVCAVGAALTDDDLARTTFDLSDVNAAFLPRYGVAEFEDEDFALELQREHDDLIKYRNRSGHEYRVEKFKSHIGYSEPEGR